MIQNFLPYQESLELKELGFDEPCVGFYQDTSNLKAIDQHWGMSICGISESGGFRVNDITLAPLFSQVFKFFRDKYNLYHYITTHDGSDFEWYIYDKDQLDWEDDTTQNTYEEAELICARKLIEIVKKQNNG